MSAVKEKLRTRRPLNLFILVKVAGSFLFIVTMRFVIGLKNEHNDT